MLSVFVIFGRFLWDLVEDFGEVVTQGLYIVILTDVVGGPCLDVRIYWVDNCNEMPPGFDQLCHLLSPVHA